jgi:hypothetical protein
MNFKNPSKLLLLTGAAFVAPQAHAFDEWDQPSDWTRNLRVGMQIGLNINAKFKTSGAFAVPGSGASANGVKFDNGYVLKDSSGSTDGRTWNWGYDNASQLSGSTLTYKSTTGYDVQNSGTRSKGDEPYVGFDMGYGWTFARLGSAKVGAEFGFGLLPISISDRQPLQATLSSQNSTVDTTGIEVPLGGYHGTFQGPGVTIPTAVTPGAISTTNGPVSGSRTLDVNLYTFRLGPTLFWELNPKIGVGVSAGGAFGIVSGDYEFRERPAGSTGNFFTGKFGKTDFVYGGYISALTTYRIEDHGDLFLGAQFMSLTDSTFRQGGREAKLGLGSGIYITAGINWPF